MSVAAWLDYVDKSLILSAKNVSLSLSNLFVVDTTLFSNNNNNNIAFISSLQNDILDNALNISTLVDSKNFYDGDWSSFSDLCTSYLTFVQDVDPSDPRSSYNSLIQYVTALQIAFTNGRGSILQDVVKKTVSGVLKLGKTLDVQDKLGARKEDQLHRTNYLSTLLLKMFNNIRAEKTLENAPGGNNSNDYLSKKNIILFVANMLCRSYYTLHTESSCANVFSNIHTAKLTFSAYSKSEQVEYRYFLGRHYLSKEQLSRAYDHLDWAFRNCLPRTNQQRLVLVYLIPASMLLGKLPRPELLRMFNLENQYGPLVSALKAGNCAKFFGCLEQEQKVGGYKEWYIKKRVMFLFKNRAPIVLLRQVVFKAYQACEKKNILRLGVAQSALRLSTKGMPYGWFDDSNNEISNTNPGCDENFEVTENVFITLIHQGFIKGNIYSRTGLVRLRDKNPFPDICEVDHLNSRTVYPLDKWLET